MDKALFTFTEEQIEGLKKAGEIIAQAVKNFSAPMQEQSAEERYAFWRPEKGRVYWYSRFNGEVTGRELIRFEDDLKLYNYGNIYPTKEAAERVAHRQRVLRRLERAIEVENEGKERGPEWYSVCWMLGRVRVSTNDGFIPNHPPIHSWPSAERIADWLSTWPKEDLRALFPGAAI